MPTPAAAANAANSFAHSSTGHPQRSHRESGVNGILSPAFCLLRFFASSPILDVMVVRRTRGVVCSRHPVAWTCLDIGGDLTNNADYLAAEIMLTRYKP